MKQVDWSQWNSTTNNYDKYKDIKSEKVYGEFQSQIPKVSVVLLTYKRADGLKRALESAMNQDYGEAYDIVVVDDSGYDEATDRLMKEYCNCDSRIVYFRHDKNLGQYANWNRACEICRTEWFCLLHDDDELFPNYLSSVTKHLGDNLGLLGIYFLVKDERNINQGSFSHKLTKGLTDLFIFLRGGKPILVSLSDNIKHIFVLSCCMMINKDKVMKIGGLNDAFYPSSDFALCAKMNCFYQVAFLPQYLAYRGIGENESLRIEVCEDSIICAYNQTKEMIQYLRPGRPSKYYERIASRAAIAAEIGVRGYHDIDYSKVKLQLGMNRWYSTRAARMCIYIYSRFMWGKLLFRKGRKNE